jgi:hypothetical protein
MFPKALHNAQNPSKEIRNNRWLIVPLDHEVHNELHRNIGIVPVMGWLMETRLAKDYYPHPGDYVKSVEGLAMDLENIVGCPNVPRLEKDLGILVVRSLYMQLPYIRQGLIIPGEET